MTPTRAVALALLLSACTSEVELMRRYKGVEEAPDRNSDLEVTVFSVPVASGAPRGPLDLSERAQAQYIAEVARKVGSAEELRGALAQSFERGAGLGGDFGILKRRIVLSALDQGLRPGDRLERLEVTLALAADSPVEFVSWDRFSNAYETLDLGSVKLSKRTEISATAGLDLPVTEITDLSVTPKISRDLTEDLKVTQKYARVAGSLTPTSMRILQQGQTGIDISGTSTVDVVMRFKHRSSLAVYRFQPPVAGNDPKPAALKLGYAEVPDSACPVRVQARYSYRVRIPVTGHESVVEGDDVIRLTSHQGKPQTHVLANPEDFAVPILTVGGQGTDVLVVRPRPSSRVDRFSDLRFTTLDDINQLLSWLQERQTDSGSVPTRIGRFDLAIRADGAGPRAISAADLGLLVPLYRQQGNCTPPPAAAMGGTTPPGAPQTPRR